MHAAFYQVRTPYCGVLPGDGILSDFWRQGLLADARISVFSIFAGRSYQVIGSLNLFT